MLKTFRSVLCAAVTAGVAVAQEAGNPVSPAEDIVQEGVAPAEWTTDFDAALARAKERDSLLVVAFLGSDWSGWCAKLKMEVFDQEEFLAAAGQNYELVLVDFPRDPESQSDEQREANLALKERYKVPGYPTVLYIDSDGRPHGKSGYQEGGPERYLLQLQQMRSRVNTAKQTLERATKKEGREKVRELVALQRMIDAEFQPWFAEELALMEKENPGDTWGIRQYWELQKEWRTAQMPLVTAYRSGDFQQVIRSVDAFVERVKPRGVFHQEVLLAKIYSLANLENFDRATAVAEQALALEPESRLAAQLRDLPAELERMEAELAAAKAKQEEETDATPASPAASKQNEE